MPLSEQGPTVIQTYPIEKTTLVVEKFNKATAALSIAGLLVIGADLERYWSNRGNDTDSTLLAAPTIMAPTPTSFATRLAEQGIQIVDLQSTQAAHETADANGFATLEAAVANEAATRAAADADIKATPTEENEANPETLRFQLPESLDSMPGYHIDTGEQPGEKIGHWIYDSEANTAENGWGGAFPWEVNIGSKSEGVTFETDGTPGKMILKFEKGAHLIMAIHIPGVINPDTGEIDTGFLYTDGEYAPELGLDMSWNNVDTVTDKIFVGRYDTGKYYIDKDHNPIELVPNRDGYVGIKMGAQPGKDERFFFEITAENAGTIEIDWGAHANKTKYNFSGERFLIDETPVAWKKTISNN